MERGGTPVGAGVTAWRNARVQAGRQLTGRSSGTRRGTVSALLALVALLLCVVPAAAQAPIELSTPYPFVAVEPGADVSFPLTLTSTERQSVRVSVASVPEGWTAQLRGGGFNVDGVMTNPEEPPELQLAVTVPPDVADGNYEMRVNAQGTGTSASLAIAVRVTAAAAGTVELTSNFPTLVGTVEESFSFSLTLRNDTPRDLSFELSAQAPEGWTARARPAGEELATTLTVEAGSTGTVNVEANPGPNVTAGDYPIRVIAAGEDQDLTADLAVTIVGEEALELSTPDQRLNTTVTAGGSRDLELTLFNPGTAPLENVTLESDEPEGWTVTFEPPTVAAVEPGRTETVRAIITPAGNAIAGDYIIPFDASTETANATAEIRVTVETSISWAIVGIVLIVLALVALGWVFRTFGRR